MSARSSLLSNSIYFLIAISIASCKKTSQKIVIDPSFEKQKLTDTTKIDYDNDSMFLKLTTDSSSKCNFTTGSKVNKNNIRYGWQGCPSIGYENGNLFISYYVGANGEEPGNFITVAVSKDMGETWQKDALIISQNSDQGRVLDSQFWNDKYGSLRLSWTMSETIWDGGLGGVWASKIKLSGQDIVLTKPKKFFNGIMNVKPTHLSKDSTSIIFPVSGWNITTNTLNNFPSQPTPIDDNGAFLYKADYNHTQKKLLPPVKLCRLPNKLFRLFDEHMMVETDKDEWMCIMRTDGSGLSFMKTTDAGITWSPQALFTDLGPTTASRFYFGKLMSGNLIMVMNSSTKREKMTAFLSKDHGKTWPYKLLLDERLGSSYPDLVQTPNGNICITYDYNRTYPFGNINFLSFTEGDIVKGNSNNIKRILVAQL